MTIVRSPRPESGWTVLSNDVIRDSALSYRARGVLASILSRPDNWRTTAEALTREGREGREAIRTALTELESAGYLRRERVRHADGTIRTVTTVYDRPDTGDGFPGAGLPDAGSLGVNRSTETKQREETPVAPVELFGDEPRSGFDEFWEAYPRKAGKRAARSSYDRAMDRLGRVHGADRAHQMILDGVSRYAADPNRESGFTAHPSTWLNQDRWEDDPIPSRPGRVSATAMYLDAAHDLAPLPSWYDPPALEA